MKKTLLTFLFAVATVVAMAQTKNYTDDLIVSLGGAPMPAQKATIIVDQNANGTYKLALNNFNLGGEMPVGNIVLDNIETTVNNNIKYFEVNQSIFIEAGDDEGYWLGPELGENFGALPVSLVGKMDAEKLHCTIEIDLTEAMGFIVNVEFGNNFTAVNYTDDLIVSLDGAPMPAQKATIIVDQNANGTYKLALNNFNLGGEMPVGNIVLDNIETTVNNNIKYFEVNQSIFIEAGDDEGYWLGPELGENFGALPVSLVGKMDAEKLHCTIEIDLTEAMGFVVNVEFGYADAVTNIDNIAVENGASAIYDLTGRKVNTITNAGIYIVNGKKVLVK